MRTSAWIGEGCGLHLKNPKRRNLTSTTVTFDFTNRLLCCRKPVDTRIQSIAPLKEVGDSVRYKLRFSYLRIYPRSASCNLLHLLISTATSPDAKFLTAGCISLSRLKTLPLFDISSSILRPQQLYYSRFSSICPSDELTIVS